MMSKISQAYIGSMVASQATGCSGAGGYMQWAQEHGYEHVEVLNWSSSAADWQFLVSKDGIEWYILSQTNNYPRAGFSRGIVPSEFGGGPFFGDIESVYEQIDELTGGS